MSRLLFELCGKDKDKRFSPFVWRTRLALCQKGLSFEAVPTSYMDKDKFKEAECKTVPVLKDGDKWIGDSWDIACYLEETYRDAPSIFGGVQGETYSRFFKHWCDNTLLPRIFVLIAPDIHKMFDGENADYFYKTRTKRVGRPLEELIPLREKNLPLFQNVITPLKLMLSERDYLSGDQPLYPDYVAYGALKWAGLCSSLDLLEDEPEISAWYERMETWYRAHVISLEDPPLL